MSSTKRSDPVQTASERLASLLSRLPPGPVAVAFSGGADSLALALLARQLRQRRVELYTVEHN
ncbi:MAG: tRNA(Ile)-lysidine synthetase, partial [Alkalispirochaetaceae bacterium]